MSPFTRRIWLAAVLMSMGWLCTTWVRSGYTFEVQSLSQGLDTLPLSLDGYQGTDLPLDEEVSRVLAADATVNRAYRRLDGSIVILHASAWVQPETVASVAPHTPQLCYTNAGWKLLDERATSVDTSAGKLTLRNLLFEREGERCVVSFWYQMGKSTFSTSGEARQIHRELWGKRNWPATIKFMLQVPEKDIKSALPQIEKFAATVFEWSEKL